MRENWVAKYKAEELARRNEIERYQRQQHHKTPKKRQPQPQEENVDLGTVKLCTRIPKPANGWTYPACEGSKKCRRNGKLAKWVLTDGRKVCTKCYNRYKREWCKAHNTTLKKLKQARKPKTEAERRRRIFASWRDPELDKLRLTPEYQAWRIAVLERDSYKCQHCQKTGGKLHAHHIKTFKMNPELRYDVENGITLCKKCHEDLHIANVDRASKIMRIRQTG